MKRLITTALPYVNSEPHIGNFLALVAGDTYKRFLNLQGIEASLLCGTDDNSKKIQIAAKLANTPTETFLKNLQDNFLNSCYLLDIKWDYFVKTSEETHQQKVIEIFSRLRDRGLIYAGTWEGYSDPKTGEMSPKYEPGFVQTKEDCLYFKWHGLTEQVIQYLKDTNHEGLIAQAVEWMEWDVCITSQATYGIPVPGYPQLRFYVWWDALISYIQPNTYIDTQFIGKDIQKFHAVMLIALLNCLGLSNPTNLIVNHHIGSQTRKLSKSSGNHRFWTVSGFTEGLKSYTEMNSIVIFEIFRLSSLKVFSRTSDVDVTPGYIKDVYNSIWVNNFGNLYQRVLGLVKKKNLKELSSKYGVGLEAYTDVSKALVRYKNAHLRFHYQDTIAEINNLATKANKHFQKEEGWTLEGEDLEKFLVDMCYYLRTLQGMMEPLSPQTSKRISSLFNFERWKSWEYLGSVKSLPETITFSEETFLLFPRIP